MRGGAKMGSEVFFLLYMARRISPIALVITPCLALSGCCCAGGGGGRSKDQAPTEVRDVNVYVAPVPCSVRTVAIMPFQAPTELIGTSVSDLFVTEILRSGRYQLVERSQLSKVLQETEVGLSGLTDSRAVELGKMLGAEGVIVGSVDEYGTIARKGQTYPVVGLSVRLIDTRTGSVMWSAGFASTARRSDISLSQHARGVVRAVMAALSSKWHVQKPTGRPAGAYQDAETQIRAPVGR